MSVRAFSSLYASACTYWAAAWYEWWPAYQADFENFAVNAGDVLNVTVTAYSAYSGIAIIENTSSGQSVSQQLSSGSPLCQENAEWIVEDFEEGNSLVPFANFGTVTFTGASAKTGSGSVGPSGANVIDIQQNGKTLTSVSTSGSSVTVSYV